MLRVLAILAVVAIGGAGALVAAETLADNDPVTIDVTRFGAKGDGTTNDVAAFEAALAWLDEAGGGVLHVPEGDYRIAFTSEDPRDDVLRVPSRTKIAGAPGATIRWDYTGLPLFLFDRTEKSGLRDLSFVWTGEAGTLERYPGRTYAFNCEDVLAHFEIPAECFPNYELATWILTTGARSSTFENLTFESATRDNAHAFAYAIVLKPLADADPVPGNVVRNIRLRDFHTGVLAVAQRDLVISGIDADRRATNDVIGSGHVAYISDDGNRSTSRGVLIENIVEGDAPYAPDLATLSIKGIKGGTVRDVVTRHPGGLIQSIKMLEDVTFENLRWESDTESTPASVIYIVPSEVRDITFRDIEIVAPRCNCTILSNAGTPEEHREIRIDGLYVERAATEPMSNLMYLAIDDSRLEDIVFKPTAYDPASNFSLVDFREGADGNTVTGAVIGPLAMPEMVRVNGDPGTDNRGDVVLDRDRTRLN
ncbi:MAG: glycosyl hydrolase family 28-related protein [Azospirillaceae bacterium]